MRLLLLQGRLRDEHGEVAVLHSQLLDLTVKELFNRLPDGKGPGPQHVAAADVVIFNHFCFSDDLQSDRTRSSLETDRVLAKLTHTHEWTKVSQKVKNNVVVRLT